MSVGLYEPPVIEIIKKIFETYSEIERNREHEQTEREALKVRLEAFNIWVSRNHEFLMTGLFLNHVERMKKISMFQSAMELALKQNDAKLAGIALENLEKFLSSVPSSFSKADVSDPFKL